MRIVNDSKKVLNAIYCLLDEDSYSLTIDVDTNDMALKLNMTRPYLNICFHYLINSGYIDGNPIYEVNTIPIKRCTLTALAINKIENDSL